MVIRMLVTLDKFGFTARNESMPKLYFSRVFHRKRLLSKEFEKILYYFFVKIESAV